MEGAHLQSFFGLYPQANLTSTSFIIEEIMPMLFSLLICLIDMKYNYLCNRILLLVSHKLLTFP